MPRFALLCAMNLLVLVGALRLGWRQGAIEWTLPVMAVFAGWLLWNERIWRVPGAEFDEATVDGAAIAWDGVVRGRIRWDYVKGVPLPGWLLVERTDQAFWVDVGSIPGGLDAIRARLGDRLIERSDEPYEAPPLPAPWGRLSLIVGSLALGVLAMWCGEVVVRTEWPEFAFLEGKKSSMGAILGVLLTIAVVYADRITRLAGFAHLALLGASLPLVARVSEPAFRSLAGYGWPVWQCVALAVAIGCYLPDWERTGQ
ncbi:MAG: hypothetical protein JNK87_09005 [Bryobacterales bacterium]|nr:hypothetical protein [Bryobacterales bacterium]